MAERTYTEKEVQALLSKATGGTDFDVIAARPYHKIEAPDGRVLSWPYTDKGDSGPLTIGGEHPDDWFGAEEQDDGKGGKKWVATKRHGGEEKAAPAAAPAAPAPSKRVDDQAAADAAELAQLRADKAAAAAGGKPNA